MGKTYNVTISNSYEFDGKNEHEAEKKAKINLKNGIQDIQNGNLSIDDFIYGFVFKVEEDN